MFVLDTGVYSGHDSLQGRVTHGADFVHPDKPIKADPHGHGTQIAGLVGECQYRLPLGDIVQGSLAVNISGYLKMLGS